MVRPFLIGVSVTVALGCAAAPRTAAPAPVPRPVAPPRVPWARFAEVSAWPASDSAFANRGHRGAGKLALVRVSPEARGAYAELVMDSVMPEGSVVALFHQNPGGASGPVFVMEKRNATWTYIAFAPDGVLAGTTSHCAGCHAAGVGDSLFGLPRARRAAPSTPSP